MGREAVDLRTGFLAGPDFPVKVPFLLLVAILARPTALKRDPSRREPRREVGVLGVPWAPMTALFWRINAGRLLVLFAVALSTLEDFLVTKALVAPPLGFSRLLIKLSPLALMLLRLALVRLSLKNLEVALVRLLRLPESGSEVAIRSGVMGTGL